MAEEITLRKRLMTDVLEKIQSLDFVFGPPAVSVLVEYEQDVFAKMTRALTQKLGDQGAGMCIVVSARYRVSDQRVLTMRLLIQVQENTTLNRSTRGTGLDAGDVALELLIQLSGWAPTYCSRFVAPERGEQLSLIANEPGLLAYEVIFETSTQLPDPS